MKESPLCCTFAVKYDHNDCRVKDLRLQFSFVIQIIVRTVRCSTKKQTLSNENEFGKQSKDSLWASKSIIAKRQPHCSNPKAKRTPQPTHEINLFPWYSNLTQSLPSSQAANPRKTTRGDIHDRSGRVDVHQIISESVDIKDILFVRLYLSSRVICVESCQWIHGCCVYIRRVVVVWLCCNSFPFMCFGRKSMSFVFDRAVDKIKLILYFPIRGRFSWNQSTNHVDLPSSEKEWEWFSLQRWMSQDGSDTKQGTTY